MERRSTNTSGEVLCCLSCRKSFHIEPTKPCLTEAASFRSKRSGAGVSHNGVSTAAAAAVAAVGGRDAAGWGRMFPADGAATLHRFAPSPAGGLPFEHFHLTADYVNANVLDEQSLSYRDLAPIAAGGDGEAIAVAAAAVAEPRGSDHVAASPPTSPTLSSSAAPGPSSEARDTANAPQSSAIAIAVDRGTPRGSSTEVVASAPTTSGGNTAPPPPRAPPRIAAAAADDGATRFADTVNDDADCELRAVLREVAEEEETAAPVAPSKGLLLGHAANGTPPLADPRPRSRSNTLAVPDLGPTHSRTPPLSNSSVAAASPLTPLAGMSPIRPNQQPWSWGAGVQVDARMDPAQATALVHHLLHSVSNLAELDLPICRKCWRQWISDRQRDGDAARGEVQALEELLERVSADSLALCFVAERVGGEAEAARCRDVLATLRRVAADAGGGRGAEERGVTGAGEESDASALHQGHIELMHEIISLERELEAETAAARELENEERALAEEEAELVAAEAVLDVREDNIDSCRNDLLAHEFVHVNEAEMLQQRVLHTERRLERYRGICSLSEVFAISADSAPNAAGPTAAAPVLSPIATINGLRIGRLPSVAVPPEEINAGCAFALHLLDHLAAKHKADLGKYRPQLLGCCSAIDVVTGGNGGGASVKRSKLDFFINTRFFSWKTFGDGWVAFAACLGAVVELLRKRCAEVEDATNRAAAAGGASRAPPVPPPPCAIEQGKVGGASVNYGSVPDEVWTRGVRNALVLLKWCITADAALERRKVLDLDVENGDGNSGGGKNCDPPAASESAIAGAEASFDDI